MVTKRWKVYGAAGHRQRASFGTSALYDWSDGTTRIVRIDNYDLTGTHDYSVLTVTRDTAAECDAEMLGQLSDGVFENCRVGKVEEVRA